MSLKNSFLLKACLCVGIVVQGLKDSSTLGRQLCLVAFVLDEDRCMYYRLDRSPIVRLFISEWPVDILCDLGDVRPVIRPQIEAEGFDTS